MRGRSRGRRDVDVVVVGGGHNGLVCAAYLARAGVDALLVEARDEVGGCASTVSDLGARFNICSCAHTLVRAMPFMDDLDLAAHGLRYLEADPATVHMGFDGNPPWLFFNDSERTIESIARHRRTQADAYRRFLTDARPVAELALEMGTGAATTPRMLARLLARRARGGARLLQWSRASTLDVLRHYLDDEALVMAAVSNGPTVWGAPPDRPGTGLAAALFAMRHIVKTGRPAGGSGALTEALAASFKAAGGQLRCGTAVTGLLDNSDRGRGSGSVGVGVGVGGSGGSSGPGGGRSGGGVGGSGSLDGGWVRPGWGRPGGGRSGGGVGGSGSLDGGWGRPGWVRPGGGGGPGRGGGGGGRVMGVRLADGTEITAAAVVVACDPALVATQWLPAPRGRAARRFVDDIGSRPAADGYQSKVDAVITELPCYSALDQSDLLDLFEGRDPNESDFVISPTASELAEGHRLRSVGRVAERPTLIAQVPSVLDPSMRSTDGHHVLSLEALFTPYALQGGWEGSSEPERWLKVWSRLLQPGFLEHIDRHRVMTPDRYERELFMARGYTPSYAAPPLWSLLGRRRELSRHRGPVPGLFLSGAGTFPGAGIWGAAGRNTANAVLRSLT